MGASAACMIESKRHVFVDGLSLSDEQIKHVSESWELIKESGSEKVGLIVFKRLFEKAPETFNLFGSFKDITDWENSRAYHHHCRTVVNLLGYFVKVLSNEELVERNADYMGMRHCYFKISPRHFEILGQELIKTFEEMLGDKFTPQAKEAWIVTYTIISTSIQLYQDKYNNEFGYDRLQEKKVFKGEEG